jgi:hypothetical protein
MYESIQSTTTSFGFVVDTVMVNEVPAVQTPVVLPSSARAGGLELGSVVWVSTVRQGVVHPEVGGYWFW